MNFTSEELDERLRRNPSLAARNPGQVAQLEPCSCDAAPAAVAREAIRAGRFSVRVESVRRKLTDGPHAICEKWLVDCLTEVGVIPDDSFREIDLKVTQRKSRPGESEHTVLEVFETQ